MKKTNRFWVILPAVAMLFTSALQASESTTTNTTYVNVVKPTPSQLNLAISKGDLAKVQQLVGIGVDVNKKDERGKTPLMYAILFNQPQIVSYLIGNGADYRALDDNGVSILEYAEKSKSEAIIKLVKDARKRR
ncbi:MAG: ankyrin repeat domain-containing protein [Flavobacterium sp.]|uniref:ankyrin repeat domain-containing protein n=1 Tax=Flavobacterium sp. TaxID=239 RepID=UPI0025BFDDC6|nr:ankyrin repeat domain-containing protein [Flavobacterium sp.]MCK6607838.1 ankyrin repeat domain-containing protein [Flavobacterium sp.]